MAVANLKEVPAQVGDTHDRVRWKIKITMPYPVSNQEVAMRPSSTGYKKTLQQCGQMLLEKKYIYIKRNMYMYIQLLLIRCTNCTFISIHFKMANVAVREAAMKINACWLEVTRKSHFLPNITNRYTTRHSRTPVMYILIQIRELKEKNFRKATPKTFKVRSVIPGYEEPTDKMSWIRLTHSLHC